MNEIAARSASSITRRTIVGGVSAIALALGLAHHSGLSAASAQDATPPAEPFGSDTVLLGGGALASVPGTELLLLRTTMTPGGAVPAHIHYGPFVLAVESGTWGYTPQSGSVKVTRAAADGNFGPAEEVPLDTEVILTAGDFIFIENASQDWMRNAGEDDVVFYIAALNPVGEDFGVLLSELEMMGTPTS